MSEGVQTLCDAVPASSQRRLPGPACLFRARPALNGSLYLALWEGNEGPAGNVLCTGKSAAVSWPSLLCWHPHVPGRGHLPCWADPLARWRGWGHPYVRHTNQRRVDHAVAIIVCARRRKTAVDRKAVNSGELLKGIKRAKGPSLFRLPKWTTGMEAEMKWRDMTSFSNHVVLRYARFVGRT